MVFSDSTYVAVMFQADLWEMGMVDCLGFIYSFMVEEFNKPETTPTKRLMMCNFAINNRTGAVLKNAYEGRHL